MIVNTLIKSNDHEKFRCMGYSSPKTLLHVTSFNLLMIRLRNITEKDNQLLLNVFNK